MSEDPSDFLDKTKYVAIVNVNIQEFIKNSIEHHQLKVIPILSKEDFAEEIAEDIIDALSSRLEELGVNVKFTW